MRPARVVVTGSRTWTDREAVDGALDLIAQAAREEGRALIVAHGACEQGADRIADEWCRRRIRQGWPVEVDRWPAEWAKYGKGAGPRRNRKMLEPGADACLAFVAPCADPKCKRPEPHGSHGASHCADYAESVDIKTVRVESRAMSDEVA